MDYYKEHKKQVKPMSLTYKQRVELALESSRSLSEVDEVEKAVERTQYINRRTKAGRKLTQELLELCRQKALDLIEKDNIQPF